MPFIEEDKALIKNLYPFKGYASRRLLAEFLEKNWTRGGLESLLRKLQETGSTDRRHGSGRQKSACTEDNVYSAKRTSHRLIDIQRDRSVMKIIHRDLRLKCFKKRRAQELTEANRHARFRRSKLLLKKILVQ